MFFELISTEIENRMEQKDQRGLFSKEPFLEQNPASFEID